MAVTVITEDNFEQEVLKSEKPVLLDLWATWCGPCRMLSPLVDAFAEERSDVKVGKIDVDEEPGLAERFGVSSIPTLIVIKNGVQTASSVGVISKDAIAALVEK